MVKKEEKAEKPKKPRSPSPRKGQPRKMTPAILANPGGRPSVFDEASPIIISLLRKGNTYDCASGCARITYHTFNTWMKEGLNDIENGLVTKLSKFYHDVRKAEKDFETEVLGMWVNQIPENWQAAKEYLARRNSKEWGSKDKVDVTSNDQTISTAVFLPMKDDSE